MKYPDRVQNTRLKVTFYLKRMQNICNGIGSFILCLQIIGVKSISIYLLDKNYWYEWMEEDLEKEYKKSLHSTSIVRNKQTFYLDIKSWEIFHRKNVSYWARSRVLLANLFASKYFPKKVWIIESYRIEFVSKNILLIDWLNI